MKAACIWSLLYFSLLFRLRSVQDDIEQKAIILYCCCLYILMRSIWKILWSTEVKSSVFFVLCVYVRVSLSHTNKHCFLWCWVLEKCIPTHFLMHFTRELAGEQQNSSYYTLCCYDMSICFIDKQNVFSTFHLSSIFSPFLRPWKYFQG